MRACVCAHVHGVCVCVHVCDNSLSYVDRLCPSESLSPGGLLRCVGWGGHQRSFGRVPPSESSFWLSLRKMLIVCSSRPRFIISLAIKISAIGLSQQCHFHSHMDDVYNSSRCPCLHPKPCRVPRAARPPLVELSPSPGLLPFQPCSCCGSGMTSSLS